MREIEVLIRESVWVVDRHFALPIASDEVTALAHKARNLRQLAHCTVSNL